MAVSDQFKGGPVAEHPHPPHLQSQSMVEAGPKIFLFISGVFLSDLLPYPDGGTASEHRHSDMSHDSFVPTHSQLYIILILS